MAGTASTTSVTGVAFKSGDAASVELTLSPAVAASDTGITVSYTRGNDPGPLQDASGNKVADFSGQQVTNATDAVPRSPTLQSATVDRSTLTLIFSKALKTTNAPGTSRFSVAGTDSVTSVTAVRFISVRYAGHPRPVGVELTLSSAVTEGDSGITVSYAKGTDANPLQDAAGNTVADFTGQQVTNVTDATAPTVQDAEVDGSTLTLIFTEALRDGRSNRPSASRFTLTGTASATSVTAVAFRAGGRKLDLTLSTAVAQGRTGITVSYAKGNDANPLQDASGNQVADFTGQQVTNVSGVDTRIVVYAGNPVTEGAAASFTVGAVTGLGGPATLSSDLTVNLSVSEAAGSDFVAVGDEGSKTVVIAAGQIQATYTVDTVDDSTDESNGSVTVSVRSGAGYRLGPTDSISASARVDDNDAPAPPRPPDTTTPTVQSAEVNGSTLTLTFNEPLKTTSAPGTARFTVAGTDSATSVTAVAFKGGHATKVELTLSPTVAEGDTGINVSYAQGDDANPLQDASGNQVADFTGQQVTNVTDTTAPAVQAAEVDGSTLTLTFTEALKTTKVPSASRFTVAGTASATSVTAAAIKTVGIEKFVIENVIELTLSSAVPQSDTGITVSYAKGNDANPLQDAPGNEVADFSGRQVENVAGVDLRIIIFAGHAVTEGAAASFSVETVNGLGQAQTLSSALTVNLSVSEAAGSDFVAAGDEGSKTVVIAAGQSEATYTVATVDDSTDEPNGSVTVRVRSGAGYRVGQTDQLSASVRVDDNDGLSDTPANTRAPTVQRATVDGSVLALTFSTTMDTAKVPSPSRFTVAGTDNPTTVTAVRFFNTTRDHATPLRLELTLSPTVGKGDKGITLSYAQGNDAKPLQDAAGDKLADFSGQAVANATGVPTVESATVAGSTLTLTFTEPLYTGNPRPSTARFSVAGTESATSVTAVAFKSGDATSVELTLSPAVTAGDSGITVSYARGNEQYPLQETSHIQHLDVEGNPVVNLVADFSGQQVTNNTPDTTAPTVQRATVDGSLLALVFNEAMDRTKVPSTSRFTVAGTNSATSVTAVSFFNTPNDDVPPVRLELTLSPAVAEGDTGITVSYAQGNDANPLQNASGDKLADFSAQQVTNVTDTTAPTAQSAEVDGATLTLTFNEDLFTGGDPPNRARFAVAGTASATSVTAVAFKSGDAASVELTLSPAVTRGETGITVSYTVGSDLNALADPQGNEVEDFSGQQVTNNTGIAPEQPVGGPDTTAPTVTRATVDGSLLALVLNESMDTTKVPSGSRFTVAGAENNPSVTAVAFRHSPYDYATSTRLELTLSPAVAKGDKGITLTYAQGNDAKPLQDAAGNKLANFSGHAVPNATGAPTVESATVVGSTLTLTFTEPLDTYGLPSSGAFSVAGTDSVTSVTAVAFKSGDASSVELTLSPAVLAGDTGITVSYGQRNELYPLEETTHIIHLEHLDGSNVPKVNRVEDFTGQQVTNNTAADTTAPTVQSATVIGSTLTLTFNESLKTATAPSTSRFTVAGTQSATSVTAVAFKTGDAASVVLTLSPAVAEGDTGITLSYAQGNDANPLQDRSGNKAADFTGQLVANGGIPAALPAPVVSAVPLQPDRLSVSWSAPGGTTVTDYDLRYYKGSADPADPADWIEPGEAGGHDHRGRLATATITGLLPVTTYRVQVRAVNNGDAGPWSASGSGRTEGVVGAWGTAVQELVGNIWETVGGSNSLAGVDVAQGLTAAGHSLGYTVTHVDLRFDSAPDANVQVRLATGVSTSSRGTTVATLRNPRRFAAGVVTFTAPPRTTLSPNGNYFVVVEGAAGNLSWTTSTSFPSGLAGWSIDDRFTRSAAGWTSVSGKALVRVNGRQNVGDPPGAPEAPTVTAVTGSTSVTASWSAPDHTGSGITDYDLRYHEGSADPADEADWVEEHETTGLPEALTTDASTGATITGLQPNTAYRVQVRAESHEAPGPWSESASVTTNAATGSNNAPTRAKLGTVAQGCIADPNTHQGSFTVFGGALYSIAPITDTSECVTGSPNRIDPMFIDPDGDDLAITAVAVIPDNVRLLDGTPWMDRARDRFFVRAVAAGSVTDVRINFDATDPHGETVDAWYNVKVRPPFDNNSAPPRFDEMVGTRGFPVGAPVGRWVLPPANGGDMVSVNATGQLPYFYAISGLPPGLSFDPLTRTVTGTPTQAGSYTVTYTADDADYDYSLKDSPTAADLADVARQSFVVRIGAPAIELVQIVSAPTYDANGDGSFDTYIQGDRILVDVQFTEAVEVTGTPERLGARPRLRLDLGPRDGSENLNRVLADMLEEGGEIYGGRRLRFGYTVQGGNGLACSDDASTADCDPDGVWVQTAGADGTVVFVPKGLSVTSVESGAVVVRTFSGLPRVGGANAKVDGSVTSASIGPRPLSAVTDAAGDTVTVTFNRALNTQVDLSGTPLAAYFAVRGAGVVGAGARGHYQHPNRVTVSGSTAVLELNTPANASDTVTLSYENVGGAVWPLKDQSSPPKRVAGWIDLAVTNNSTGVAAPVPTSASAVGTALELVFDQRLDQDSRPPGSAFTVRAENVDRVRRTIAGVDTAVVIDDAKVAVTLAAAVAEGELLQVSYATPAESPLRNAASTAAVASFEAFKVEGVYDSTAPTLLSKLANIQLTPANDDASQGKSSIMLYYDERLDRTSVPAVGDFALSSTDSGAVAGAVVSSVAVEDTAVVVTTSHWLRDNIDYTLAYTPGTAPIEDLAGNAVAAFTETVRSFAVGQPVLRGSTVAGIRLELDMTSPLNPAAVPPPSAFKLWEQDVVTGEMELHEFTGIRIVSVAVNAWTAVLQLNHPVYPCAGETVFRVSYTLPASGDERFQTAAGWGADGWTATKWKGQANDHALVTNARHGRCADWLAGTFIGSVILKAERAFARNRGEPEPAWFTVSASGGPVRVTGAAFDPNDPKALKLSLSREFAPGETVTVSYRRPAGVSGLWDTAGNQLRDVVNAPVRTPYGLSVADARAVEGEAVEFTVSLSAASDQEVTVDYATSDGTAESGMDYTAASGTLTFVAGVTSQTVRVETAEDAADEDDETFTLTLSNPSGAALATASATGTIEDPAPALTASFHGLPEAHDGSLLFGFEIRFSEGFDGLKLTALESGALALTGGRLVDTKRTVRGENRSVTVRVRPATTGDLTLTLAVTDDCTASSAICASDGRKLTAAVTATVPGPASGLPVLDVADTRAEEGATLSFAVTLSHAATETVTVDYATADGSATAGTDYIAASGTLTFAAGDTEKTVEVATLADTASEGDETLTLTLTSASGATIGDVEATGSVTEAAAALTASFHGLPQAHDGARLFAFEIRFSEEFDGLRLTALEAGGLTVTGGRLVDVKRTVRGNNQSVTARVRPAAADQVTLTIAATTDCSLPAAICASDGRKLSAAVTATVPGPAAPAALPVLDVADASADEGDTLVFAVTLSQAATGAVTVDFATTDGSAAAGQDYSAASGTLTFAAGETSKTVEVATLADRTLDDGETLTLTLSGASGADIGDGEAVGTIADVPPLPGVRVADARADEGQTLAFAVTLSEATTVPVTVDYATADGSATAGADYTAAAGTLTFAPDETEKTVAVALFHDAFAEGDETLTLALSNVSRATIAGGQATGTIVDVAPLTAAFEGMPAEHDGKRLFRFVLAFSDNFPGRFPHTMLRDNAFTVTNGSVRSAERVVKGENRRWRIGVRPASNDDLTITLAAGAVSTEAGRPLANTVTATVKGPALLSVADAEAKEGETLKFAVTLDRTATGTVTVDYATADGSASAGTDYTAASGTLTFAPGQTEETVAVALLHDAALEGDETLTLRLSNASGAAIIDGQATGTVIDVPPLTASFEDMPQEHDGKKLFHFVLAFSENFPGRFPYTTLRDSAFTVTGGRVRSAERVVKGENRRWRIGVRPSSNDDVTITLAAGAVSTEAGRPLANTVTATVKGPALLSVADAEGNEGEDAAVDFAVTLSRAAYSTVTVDYATFDETAIAGEDYTAVSGTLTFAVGVTAMTVSVPLLDDVLDDGGETFVLRLSNPQGAAILDGEGRATIHNSDPIPRAWNARFGRTVSEHLVDALQERLERPASESYVQLGGHRLGGPHEGLHDTVQRLAPERSLWEEQPAGPVEQAVTFRELLLGSAFHLLSNDAGEVRGPRLSAWGRAATSGFDGQEEKVTLNGTVTTATLGVDGTWKRWLSGVALAYSEGDGSFTHLDMPGGALKSSLTSVHPYAAYTLSDRVRLWGMVGYGSGALQIRLEDKPDLDTDLTLTMGALGVRGTLLQPTAGRRLQLELRSDVVWTGTDSARTDNLAATEAETSRLRLALEGSRPVALAGGSLTPTLEVGLRVDGGDAETGTGIEVGGGLRYASAWGLSIEASVRSLVAHEDADYREWGASAALRFAPGGDGKGLTASVMPTWGQAASGVTRLWDQRGMAGGGLSPAAAGRLDAELGYGLAAFGGRGLLTPYARVGLSEGADQAWHVGTRLALRESLNLSLEASRRASDGQAAAHEVALIGTLGW